LRSGETASAKPDWPMQPVAGMWKTRIFAVFLPVNVEKIAFFRRFSRIPSCVLKKAWL
jgi:hypothetical protein